MTETTNHRDDEATVHADSQHADLGTSAATTVPGPERFSAGARDLGADAATGRPDSDAGTAHQPGGTETGHTAADQTTGAAGAAAEPGYRRFRRRRDGMIGGVCGGAGDLLGIDATLVRVGLVAATILGFGMGILLYLVCWVVVPQE